MGDETPFDAGIFADRPELGGGSAALEFKSDEAMARNMVRLQPSRDPNDVRESYGLKRLDEDALEAWLADEAV